nr:hypothetical protein [Sporichthya sp.]
MDLDISGLTWTLTIALILGLLALDLVLASVRPHQVGFAEAAAWSVFYIGVAIAFGLWFTAAHGGDYGTEFFAGYIVEKSLSVDNLFAFVIIVVVLATVTVTSMLKTRQDPTAVAHAGSLTGTPDHDRAEH